MLGSMGMDEKFLGGLGVLGLWGSGFRLFSEKLA